MTPHLITRGILAFIFVWLMLPHEPDVGLGRPQSAVAPVAPASACRPAHDGTCDGVVFHALFGSIDSLVSMRANLLDGIERVRADVAANRHRSHTALQHR
jgi:hypothetical protein